MSEGNEATAILGGGCFWCIEGIFQYVDGVIEVLSGYAGGETPNPDYKSVCTGRTGHAEVVRVRYDPEQVGFDHLLDVFFTIHDPTQLNRQGNDVGPQYRSVIFCLDEDQRTRARQKIDELSASGTYRDPIVTEIAGPATFYPAEDYHQRFFEQNAGQPYCEIMIRPKLEKFQKRFGG
jgi:peptide-methionine (S)-S-oxide reductase